MAWAELFRPFGIHGNGSLSGRAKSVIPILSLMFPIQTADYFIGEVYLGEKITAPPCTGAYRRN